MAGSGPFPWRAVAAGVFIAACAALLLGPVTVLLLGAWGRGELTLANFPEGAWPRLTALWWATVRLTAAAALLAGVLGAVMALAIQRSHGAWRRFLAAAYPLPLLLPPAVVAIAWTHLLGKRGLAAEAWRGLTGAPELPFSIYGEAGSAVVLALCWFPLVTMPLQVGLRAVGDKTIAAGRLYASPWRRVWRIDLPLLLPYATAGMAFVAWLALGDFEVPCVFLRRAFPMEIYAALQGGQGVGRALLWCLPLLALSALVWGLRQAAAGRAAVATADSTWRTEEPPADAPPRSTRVLQWSALAILLLTVVVPVASLAQQAGSWAAVRAALETAGDQVLNSFYSGAGAVLILLALGIPYARLWSSARGWRRDALACLALLPVALPATLHGLAWIEALKPTEWGRALLGSPGVLALSAAARFFPFVVFLLAAVFDGLPPRLLDAARGAGAAPWRVWAQIIWPLAWPGLLAALAIGFALALGELGASVLLQPPGFATLPVRLSSLLHFGKDELVAGLCLVQVFLALTPYLAAALLLERTLEVRLG